jgi:hypothetical protein
MRQHHVIPAASVHDAGPAARGISRTPEDIAAHRALDRAPGILGDHQTTHTIRRSEPLIRL